MRRQLATGNRQPGLGGAPSDPTHELPPEVDSAEDADGGGDDRDHARGAAEKLRRADEVEDEDAGHDEIERDAQSVEERRRPAGAHGVAPEDPKHDVEGRE